MDEWKGCLCEDEIQRVRSMRYLGVIVDDRLEWSKHVLSVCGKMRKCLGMMYLMRNKASIKTKKIIYTALAESHLSYALTAWGRIRKDLRKKIKSIQKKILKYVFNNKPNHLKMDKEEVFTIEGKYIHSLLVQYYWDEEIKPESELRHSERSSRAEKFRNVARKKIRTKYGKGDHRFLVPVIWEYVPEELTQLETYQSVKMQLKKWLLSKKGKEVIKTIFK